MELFVFACGLRAADRGSFVAETTAGLAHLVSTVLGKHGARVSEASLPGALCLSTTEADDRGSGIAMAEGRDHVVLVYGDAGDHPPATWATRLDAAGDPGEIMSEIAGEDGCFGCLIYRKSTREIRIFGDVAGQRTLRWAMCGDGSIVVSSHDLGLVAARAVAPCVDETSMDSIRSMGWSIGDRSLLQGISVCPAGHVAILRPGRSGRSADASCRVEPLVAALPRANRPLTEILVESLGRRLEGHGTVVAELTAGFDSRATLAALLALRDPRNVSVFTEGPDDAEDVVVARRIAELAGLTFEHRRTPGPSGDDLVRSWSRASAMCNGIMDISVLASRRDTARADGPLTVCGDTGEIFRGYYQSFKPFSAILGLSEGDADRILTRKMINGSLPEARKGALTDRLAACIAGLRASAVSESRVLDLFYQTQRFGSWNQRIERDAANGGRIGFFFGRKAMLAAGRSIETSREARRVHFDLIRTYLPAIMDIPINGEETVWRHGGRRIDDVALDLRSLQGKVARRIRKKLGRTPPDLEGARASAITSLCAEAIAGSDFLLSGSRFGGSVDQVEAQIDGGGQFRWAELGALRFLKLCAEVAAAASAAARSRPAFVASRRSVSPEPSYLAPDRRAS